MGGTRGVGLRRGTWNREFSRGGAHQASSARSSDDLIARFLLSPFWDQLNGSDANSIWDSDEMMKFINETLLSTSSSSSLAPHVSPLPDDGEGFANGTFGARPFFGDFFAAFHHAYLPIHGYLSIVICTFGIISNVINIAVLSQKVMRTPTNAILTALAGTSRRRSVPNIGYEYRCFGCGTVGKTQKVVLVGVAASGK